MKKAIWRKKSDNGSRKEYSLEIGSTVVGKVYRRADFIKRTETDRIRTKMVNLYDIIWDTAGLKLVLGVDCATGRWAEGSDDTVQIPHVYKLRSEADARAVVKELLLKAAQDAEAIQIVKKQAEQDEKYKDTQLKPGTKHTVKLQSGSIIPVTIVGEAYYGNMDLELGRAWAKSPQGGKVEITEKMLVKDGFHAYYESLGTKRWQGWHPTEREATHAMDKQMGYDCRGLFSVERVSDNNVVWVADNRKGN